MSESVRHHVPALLAAGAGIALGNYSIGSLSYDFTYPKAMTFAPAFNNSVHLQASACGAR